MSSAEPTRNIMVRDAGAMMRTLALHLEPAGNLATVAQLAERGHGRAEIAKAVRTGELWRP